LALRVHKIALDPNNRQRTFFAKSAGTSRFAYNWALARWKERYKAGEKPKEGALRKELNALKKEQFPWMLEVGKCGPQQSIKNLGTAYQRFFDGKGGYPKFKKKGVHDSFRADNGPVTKGANALKISGNSIQIPRLGWVRMRENLRFIGQIKSGIVSQNAGRWFISLLVDTSESVSEKPQNQGSTGIDLGIHHLATLANGYKVESPRPYKRYLQKLKRTQRSFSRKKKGSANRKKQQLVLQNLHARISNIRNECLHQLTDMVTKTWRVIGVEDLNVSGMLKNRCLARSISDMGFYEFRRQLEYKGKRRDCTIVFADRFFPSSKKCSTKGCDFIHKELSLSVRKWICPQCKCEHDRDQNAAINLERYADSSAVSACGEVRSGNPCKRVVKRTSKKQELNVSPA